MIEMAPKFIWSRSTSVIEREDNSFNLLHRRKVSQHSIIFRSDQIGNELRYQIIREEKKFSSKKGREKLDGMFLDLIYGIKDSATILEKVDLVDCMPLFSDSVEEGSIAIPLRKPF